MFRRKDFYESIKEKDNGGLNECPYRDHGALYAGLSAGSAGRADRWNTHKG